MAVAAEDRMRRLSFNDSDLHHPAPLHSEEVVAALASPSAEACARALEALAASNDARFARVLEIAREKVEGGGGDSDLRRLKRQYSSLKNNFLHYDVKELFLESLLEGLPDGTENERAAEYERALEDWVRQLSQQKERNEQLRAEVSAATGALVEESRAFGALREAVGEQLAALAAAEAQWGASAPGPLPPMEQSEGDAQAALAEAVAAARHLEASLSAVQAEAQEVETAIEAEQHELAALTAQVAAKEAAASEHALQSAAHRRFADAGAWADAMRAVLSALAGVELVKVEEDEASPALHLALTCYTQATESGDGETLRRHTHGAVVTLQPASSRPAGCEVEGGAVAVDDIVAAAQARSPQEALRFLVREVSARLALALQRRAFLDECARDFPLTQVEGGTYRATLPCKSEAVLLIPGTWPEVGHPELLDLEPLHASVDLGPTLRQLRAREDVAGGGLGLKALLQAVADAVRV